MDKRALSERDICSKFITPALLQAGWEAMTQIREEVSFTKGRIIVRGRPVARDRAKRADYVLYYQHIAIALIEAKDNTHGVGDGMQQALDYAQALNVPFVVSSNGDGFLFHDNTASAEPIESNLSLADFPSPATLWARYCTWKGLAPEQQAVVLEPYYDDGSAKEPRYYQRNAINATLEAIAKSQNRILLVMATGTGKTYTAFQIIWRLRKAGIKKRILYLADRNILINQTMVNDFRPFGGVMAKLSTASHTIERDDGTQETLVTAIDRKRRIDSSYEVYLGLYQAITGPECYVDKCQGDRAPCRRKYVREEVLEQQFTDLLGRLKFDDEVLEWVRDALHASHADERREHEGVIKRLQIEYKRLQERINAMYVDKLVGIVDAAFFEKMSNQWRAEQNRCQREIDQHQDAEKSYMDEGEQILELARNAQQLFERQEPRQKRRLLNFLLSNCSWKSGEIVATFSQPCDLLAETTLIAASQKATGTTVSVRNEIWLKD